MRHVDYIDPRHKAVELPERLQQGGAEVAQLTADLPSAQSSGYTLVSLDESPCRFSQCRQRLIGDLDVLTSYWTACFQADLPEPSLVQRFAGFLDRVEVSWPNCIHLAKVCRHFRKHVQHGCQTGEFKPCTFMQKKHRAPPSYSQQCCGSSPNDIFLCGLSPLPGSWVTGVIP